MMLEVNNTKAMLSNLLKSDFKDYDKLVQAIYEFIDFQCNIGDFSDRLISQAIEHLQQINASTSLIIDCLYIWGRVYYYADNFENAKVKLQEAEMLCKTTKENESSKHADVLNFLGETYIHQGAYNEAKISFKFALKLYKLANNMFGQADAYDGLGNSYMKLNDLNKAKASIQKALELNKLTSNTVGQGNNYDGLGDIYLELNELDKAEVSFQKALELFKLSNAILSQGHALQGLGRVQMMRSQLQNAKILFENALAMHKQAQDATGQKNDQYYLDEVLYKISQL
jgi:tetratricopeptide (TPR) repeat protein